MLHVVMFQRPGKILQPDPNSLRTRASLCRPPSFVGTPLHEINVSTLAPSHPCILACRRRLGAQPLWWWARYCALKKAGHVSYLLSGKMWECAKVAGKTFASVSGTGSSSATRERTSASGDTTMTAGQGEPRAVRRREVTFHTREWNPMIGLVRL